MLFLSLVEMATAVGDKEEAAKWQKLSDDLGDYHVREDGTLRLLNRVLDQSFNRLVRRARVHMRAGYVDPSQRNLALLQEFRNLVPAFRPDRVDAYDTLLRNLVDEAGFITTDDRKFGVSVDGLVDEADRVETENKDLLANTDLPPPDAEQRALKKDYSAEPHDHAVLKNAYRSDFTVAGGKTPAAKTTNDLPLGTKSPMTNIKRPPKPATGAKPRG
jgi:hypothetical protein